MKKIIEHLECEYCETTEESKHVKYEKIFDAILCEDCYYQEQSNYDDAINEQSTLNDLYHWGKMNNLNNL